MGFAFCPPIVHSISVSCLRLSLMLTLYFIKLNFFGNAQLKKLPKLSDPSHPQAASRKRKYSIEENNLFIDSILYVFIRIKALGKVAEKIVAEIKRRENVFLLIIFFFGAILEIETKLVIFCFVFLYIRPILMMYHRYYLTNRA